jgi:two-component system cell cycle response regulator
MLNKLKSDPALKAIPVIMLTAESGRETVLRIAKLGVRDYLIKPFKEDLIIERVGRVIDLKPKGGTAPKTKRFDDPLKILVVDDKPAILDQIRAGLTGTNWTIEGRAAAGQAVDFCSQAAPDIILVSLTLPEGTGFNLFQMLRASSKIKGVPIFALSVKTATDEQARAQQLGFTGIITKPIDFEDMKGKITRALNLDVSYQFFEQREGTLVLKLPANCSSANANHINVHLRGKVTEAVDAGLGRLVLDMSSLQGADITLIKLGLTTIQLCQELSMKYCLIGSEAIGRECKNYEETKDWQFVGSFEEALKAFQNHGTGQNLVPA